MTRRNSGNLREEYLSWLNSQLRDEHGDPEKTYRGLLVLMFETPFGWVDAIPLDENRVVDGKDLRMEFAHICGGSNRRQLKIADDLLNLGQVSFLEVLIALSRHLAFVAGGEAPGWAWQLMCNLELHRLSDPFTRPKERKAHEIMNTVISRTYAPDGTGGFFPLAWPDGDQTRVELWYQLNAYAEELHPEH